MTTYGVTSTGFVKKTRQDIIDEINADLKADISPNLNTESTSIIGQIVGIIADQLAQDWDVLQEVYDSQYPDSSAETSLDNVCSITGTTRLAATPTTVELIVTTDNLITIPAGRQARVPNGLTFETDAAVSTTGVAPAWAGSTSYSIDDIVYNDSPANIYICTTAGTSASSGGPTGDGTAIQDGTCVWRFVGVGSAYNTVAATATEDGANAVQAWQVTEIVTAQTNWTGVNNLNDAETGTDIETDSELRQRREDRLAAGGAATLEAIRTELLGVEGVSGASVFENTTDVTDDQGLPPHSIQATVVGGSDTDIAQALFDTKAAGIETYGTDISETIVDSQGTSHTINADRADQMEIYIDATVIVDGDYPNNGDDQVQQLLKDRGDELTIGDDVIYKQFESSALETSGGINGVVDIQNFYIDKQPVSVESGAAELFDFSSEGPTSVLEVRVDGQSTPQFVVFNHTTDFADEFNVTASEVQTVINNALTSPPATASVSSGKVVITSDSGGSVRVTGGNANNVLQYPTDHTPTGTSNIEIGNRQLATFDTTRITVSSVPQS